MDKLAIFLIEITKLILNAIYYLFKLLRVKNKITFISRQGNSPSIDFILLKEEIVRSDKETEVVFLTKEIPKTLSGKLVYILHIFQQMFQIATSKAVILDSYCIPVSILRQRKSLIVVQIWHALGALKKFGYSAVNRTEGSKDYIAKGMDMHRNYTYALTSSPNTIKFFAEAFQLEQNRVKPIPLPRVDLLSDKIYLEKKRKEILDKYPSLGKKKTVLYVPTFRKDSLSKAPELIKKLNKKKYNLIVREHPLTKQARNGNKSFEFHGTTLDALIIADYVITDYSAIVFEAAILHKPLFFYAYDLDTYIDNRGFYIDYLNEMPGIISKNIARIISAIEKDEYDTKKIQDFREKYVNIKDTTASKQIIDLIMK